MLVVEHPHHGDVRRRPASDMCRSSRPLGDTRHRVCHHRPSDADTNQPPLESKDIPPLLQGVNAGSVLGHHHGVLQYAPQNPSAVDHLVDRYQNGTLHGRESAQYPESCGSGRGCRTPSQKDRNQTLDGRVVQAGQSPSGDPLAGTS